MKVQHKRSGNIAEVISNDGKRVVVKDVAKGEETELAISTFKRWWKQLDADEKKEEVESPLTEVSKEILETAKKKAEAKRKSTAKTSVDRSKKSSNAKDDKSTAKTSKVAKKTNNSTKERKVDAMDVVESVCKNNNWSYSRKGKFLRVLDENGKNIAPIYRRPGAVRIYVKNSENFDRKIIIKSDSEAYGKKFAGSVFVTIENIGKVLEIIVKNSKKEEK